MQCERCHDVIADGEEKKFHGQVLCEDCYMDLLSPPKACDPWAVYSAKSFAKGNDRGPELNPVQQKILDVLRVEGPTEPKNLSEMLHIKETDLERELAALRHIEKVKGQLRNGKRVIMLM